MKDWQFSKVCLELGHCNVIDKKTLMRHQLVQDRNQNLVLISLQHCQCPSTYDWYSFDMLFPYFFPLLNLVRSLAKMYVIHKVFATVKVLSFNHVTLWDNNNFFLEWMNKVYELWLISQNLQVKRLISSTVVCNCKNFLMTSYSGGKYIKRFHFVLLIFTF